MRPIDNHPKPQSAPAPFPPLELALARIDRISVRALVKLRLERLDAASKQGIRAHRILLADADAIAAYAQRLAPADSEALYALLEQETQAALADLRLHTEALRASAVGAVAADDGRLLERHRLAIVALSWIAALLGFSLFFVMAISLAR